MRKAQLAYSREGDISTENRDLSGRAHRAHYRYRNVLVWPPPVLKKSGSISRRHQRAAFNLTLPACSCRWLPAVSTRGYVFGKGASEQWDTKIKAIRACRSQIKSVSSAYPVSLLEIIGVTCRHFGQCIGSEYGETFVSYEPLAVKKLELP